MTTALIIDKTVDYPKNLPSEKVVEVA